MRELKKLTSILYKSKIQITQNTHRKVDQEKCNFHIYCNNRKKLECIACLLTSTSSNMSSKQCVTLKVVKWYYTFNIAKWVWDVVST